MYDDYYPSSFGFDDQWQKQLRFAASRYNIKLDFQQVKITGNIPPLGPLLENDNHSIVIVTPLLSVRLSRYLENTDNPERIFLDLDYQRVPVAENQLCFFYDLSEIYDKAGRAAALVTKAEGTELYAVFNLDSPLTERWKSSFSAAFHAESGSEPLYIEIDESEPDPKIPDSYLNNPQSSLFFISACRNTATLSLSVPEHHLVAGDFLSSISPYQKNLSFSIEYLPLVHFSKLLSILAGRHSEGQEDIFRIVYFSR